MTFPRLTDGTRTYSIVERADGVRYRVYDGTATSRLPHDLGHLIVERETGDHGGFWGAVAAGVVFSSMEHLDGRRPPHARERSEAAMRERSDGLRRAELMVWLTERVARDGVTAPQQVRAMARGGAVVVPRGAGRRRAGAGREPARCGRRRSAGRSCRRARSWWWSGPTAVHDERRHGLVVPNLVGGRGRASLTRSERRTGDGDRRIRPR